MNMLGTRLKILRKEHGLRQSDIAEACGIAQTNISHWEKSGHIPDEHIDKVAELLGLSVQAFRESEVDVVEDDYASNVLGKALRLFREEKGINQATIAEAANVNPSTVSNWERSGSLPEEHIGVVSEALNITARQLRAKAAELIRNEPIQSKDRIEIWRDAMLLDKDVHPLAKSILATFPFFWNESLKAVILTPAKFEDRIGWPDGVDIHDAWALVNASGYVDPVDDGIFRLILK
jgi:transcriptional regulator with XRE-family HTH domain